MKRSQHPPSARNGGNAARRGRAGASPLGLKRVLVPVDFTAGSDQVLRQAAVLARDWNARVLPLHVTPSICLTLDCGYGPVNRTVPDEKLLRCTRARLQRLVHRVVPVELAEAVAIRNGEPIEQIATAAEEWKADLIMMLAHDGPGEGSGPPTYTVDRLVRRVRCPVLVLHAQRPAAKRRLAKRKEYQ